MIGSGELNVPTYANSVPFAGLTVSARADVSSDPPAASVAVVFRNERRERLAGIMKGKSERMTALVAVQAPV
jgi:hypothetical protein